MFLFSLVDVVADPLVGGDDVLNVVFDLGVWLPVGVARA